MIELAKIYSEYFDILEKYYLPFYKESARHNVSPENIVKDVENNTNLHNSLIKITPTVSELIENFWDRNYTALYNIYNSIPGMKARFGGDIGPHKDDKIFQRVGLYFDTIIIPDPILRIVTLPASDVTKCHYLIKYAINQLYNKEVYLSNINPPMALLIPDRELVGKSKLNFSELTQYGNIDSIIILNSLFDIKLNSVEESYEFLSKFKNIDEVYKEIHKPDLIWWDEYSPRDILAQLESVKKSGMMGLKNNDLPFDISDPRYFFLQLTGRLMQINDVLVRSDEINASPLIAAPVSFHWLKTKILENQKMFLNNNYENINLGVTNSLLSTDKEWLGNISLEDLISVRKNGFISDFRKNISSEIEMLGDISISDLEKISSQIDFNLSELFKKHQNELGSLQRVLRNELAIKGTSFIVSLTIALQPLIGNFLPSWSSTIGGLAGLSSLTDIINGVREHINKKGRLLQSPVGILVNAKNKS